MPKPRTKKRRTKTTSAIDTSQPKENITTMIVKFDETTKTCAVFGENGDKILEGKNVKRLDINFGNKTFGLANTKAELDTFNMGTGEQILGIYYSGNEIFKKRI